MKLWIVLCACVALAGAAGRPAVILRNYNDNNGLGNYRFGFEQSDGTRHEQSGELKNAGRDDEYLSVRGQYSYLSPNNVRYIVRYIADNNGYQPEIEEGPGGDLPADVAATLIGG